MTRNTTDGRRVEGAEGMARVRGVIQRGVAQREGLTTFKHLPLVGLVGREQPRARASVLGKGTLAVSQAAVLASPPPARPRRQARGRYIRRGGGEQGLTVSIPPSPFLLPLLRSLHSPSRRGSCCSSAPSSRGVMLPVCTIAEGARSCQSEGVMLAGERHAGRTREEHARGSRQ